MTISLVRYLNLMQEGDFFCINLQLRIFFEILKPFAHRSATEKINLKMTYEVTQKQFKSFMATNLVYFSINLVL